MIPYLVGVIPTPLKNMSSSVEMMIFPIYGKMFQTTNQWLLILYAKHMIVLLLGSISQAVENKVYQCIKLQHISTDFVWVVIFLCLLIIGGSYPHLAITLWLFNIAMENGPILADL